MATATRLFIGNRYSIVCCMGIMLSRLFPNAALRRKAYALYATIVDQSRKPVFYTDWAVADSLDGRFDVILLHLALLMHRLGQTKDRKTIAFSRMVCEAFIADMDRSLREMGVGDAGVKRRIKNMVQAFYGRLKAYEEAFDHPLTLPETLNRNLYRGKAPAAEITNAVRAYVEQVLALLKTQPVTNFYQGEIIFP